MGRVSASVVVAASVHQAQRAWCDTDAWNGWVVGFDRVVARDPGWPERPEAKVSWRSNPAGRGEVTERIVRNEPLDHVESEVEDAQVIAHQLARFVPTVSDGAPSTELEVEFDYRIRRRSPLTPLLDLLFVRSAMRRWLNETLERFAAATGAAARS